MTSSPASKKPIIGWREWIGLPQLGVDRINAKIDTGARTSALHAFRIHSTLEAGAPWVEFAVHPLQRQRLPEIACRAEILDERVITSSNGERQRRYVIRTRLRLGGRAWPIELTLTNRDAMGFRMLLGREALRGRVLIDPGASHRAGPTGGAPGTPSGKE